MSSKSGGAKKRSGSPVIAYNRRARFDFELLDTLEVGIQLTGTEVKSLRAQKANIAESYVQVKNGELWLINANIPEYEQGNRFNHEPRRPRKLLAHQREIARLFQGTSREGLTIVPLKIYFNDRGRVKLEIALAKGKKVHDKRETKKERDWQRDKARLLREKG
jgi:SsrA-binding protein